MARMVLTCQAVDQGTTVSMTFCVDIDIYVSFTKAYPAYESWESWCSLFKHSQFLYFLFYLYAYIYFVLLPALIHGKQLIYVII